MKRETGAMPVLYPQLYRPKGLQPDCHCALHGKALQMA